MFKQTRKVTAMYAVETAEGLIIALRRHENDALMIQTQLKAEGIETTVRKCYR